jgi:enterochelin esterase-like enzyme
MQKPTLLQKIFVGFLTLTLLSSCAISSPSPASALISATESPLTAPVSSPTPLSPSLQPTANQLTATPRTACAEQKGKWQTDSLPAEGINAEVPFKIYLPPCYGFDPNHRYPLLILLHGSGDVGDENMWPNFGLAELIDSKIAAGMPPFLVVSPRISNLQGDLFSISQIIAKTLVGYIDANYKTKASAGYRALGGLSYGAIWVVQTATVYPEVFSKLGMHSNAVQLAEMVTFSQTMLTLRADKRPLIWMDAGINDDYLWSNTKMDEVLNTDGISHFWKLGEGGHDSAYWRANLGDYLNFYSAGW